MKFLVDTHIQRLNQVRDRLEAQRQAANQKKNDLQLSASVQTHKGEEDPKQQIALFSKQIDLLSNILEVVDSASFELHCLSRIFEVLFIGNKHTSEAFVTGCTSVINALITAFDNINSGIETADGVVSTETARMDRLLDNLLEQYRSEALARLNTDLQSQISLNKFIDDLIKLEDLLNSRLKFHESEVLQWGKREDQCEAGSALKESCNRKKKSNEKLREYAAKAIDTQNALVDVLSSRS